VLDKLCNQNSNKNKGQFSSNSKIDLNKKKSRKFEHTESMKETVFNETKTSSEDTAKMKKEQKINISIMRKSWENLKR
jgi:hypothetical protein